LPEYKDKHTTVSAMRESVPIFVIAGASDVLMRAGNTNDED
jgi:hypothetical protein